MTLHERTRLPNAQCDGCFTISFKTIVETYVCTYVTLNFIRVLSRNVNNKKALFACNSMPVAHRMLLIVLCFYVFLF